MSMVPANRTSTQLAAMSTIEPLKGFITEIAVLRDRIQRFQESAFVCCPFINLDGIPEDFSVSERIMILDPDPANKDVYKGSFCDKDEVAPAKNGLLKLLDGMGVEFDIENDGLPKRTDDRSHQHVYEMRCVLKMRQIDGHIKRYPGTFLNDLRDSSERALKMTPAQLKGERLNIGTNAETKCILRALRGILSLKHTYTKQELRTKPFIGYTLIYTPDRSDPEIRRMFAAKELGVTKELYGSDARSGLLLDTGAEVDTETIDRTSQGPDRSQHPPTQTAEIINDVESNAATQTTLFTSPQQASAQAEAEDDLAGFTAPSQVAPAAVCACPCGHQKEITKEREAATTERVGSGRCQECFPGRYFNLALHKDVPSLNLKGYTNGLTPKEASEMAKADSGRRAK